MDVVYNLETYPNLFVATFKRLDENAYRSFEISARKDERHQLIDFVRRCDKMIGFNNFGFDWPLLKMLLDFPNATTEALCNHANGLIHGFAPTDWTPAIPQVDLYRIHHFDNKAKTTSLYKLKFNMRMPSIRMMPFKANTVVPLDGIDDVIGFNTHHVGATELFYHKSADKIAFRNALNPAWINYSDSKIGKQYVIEALEYAGIECYEWRDGRRVPKQTLWPDGVALKDIVLPLIQFRTPQLQTLLMDVRSQTLTDDDPFKREFELGGIEVTFGKGGLHASVNRRKYTDGIILDLDVVSYYPNIAIKNKIYPRHLGIQFCDIYDELFERRKLTKKGTNDNQALKLGLNSVFGDSGNPYSVFYDLSYMYAITINGQLMLLMLAEELLRVPGLELIQCNTDGLTVRVPEEKRAYVDAIAKAWMNKTRMTLEQVQYKRLFIRDVNNYVGEFVNGKRKNKGAYLIDREWHQNHGGLVVPKIAEKVLLEDADPELELITHPDPWDFMYRINATAKNPLVFHAGTPQQYDQEGVVRYYLCEKGERFVKRMAKGLQRVHLADTKNLQGKRGAWQCPECGGNYKTKQATIDHINDDHAPNMQLAIDYDGEPINISAVAYLSEIEKLTRDFI